MIDQFSICIRLNLIKLPFFWSKMAKYHQFPTVKANNYLSGPEEKY